MQPLLRGQFCIAKSARNVTPGVRPAVLDPTIYRSGGYKATRSQPGLTARYIAVTLMIGAPAATIPPGQPGLAMPQSQDPPSHPSLQPQPLASHVRRGLRGRIQAGVPI